MTKSAPNLDADERLAIAHWQLDQNRLDDALTTVKPLLGDDAGGEAIVIGARIYAQLRLFSRARDLFSRYLEHDPNSIPVRFQLGMTQFDEGDNAAALLTWKDVLSHQPQHPPALFYSALALLQLDESAQAVNFLQSLLQKIPTDNLYYNKAKDLMGQLEQDPELRDRIRASETFADANMMVKDKYSTEH